MSPLYEKKQRTIVMTGATGFIGTHLLNKLGSHNNLQIRALVHKSNPVRVSDIGSIEVVQGDLLDPGSLERFPIPGCTVVNLAYLNGMSEKENLLAVDNLGKACEQAGIARFIHCSTAVVSGRVAGNMIDEDTKCNPLNEYESTKLNVEKLLIEKYGRFFEIVILRPTEVFGPGGKNLLKLANSLARGSVAVNYLRSCLFKNRRTNLVSVENVTAAIDFFIFLENSIMRPEIFIVSEDDDPLCRYGDVEPILTHGLGRGGYPLPVIPVPSFVLGFLLKVSGRTNCNPSSFYSSKKIKNLGFRKKITLQEGLELFIDWYKDSIIGSQGAQN